jgi:hypothetical protein
MPKQTGTGTITTAVGTYEVVLSKSNHGHINLSVTSATITGHPSTLDSALLGSRYVHVEVEVEE